MTQYFANNVFINCLFLLPSQFDASSSTPLQHADIMQEQWVRRAFQLLRKYAPDVAGLNDEDVEFHISRMLKMQGEKNQKMEDLAAR